MKTYLIILSIAFTSPLFGGELPQMLKIRIDQMKVVQNGQVKLSDAWPDNASGLFQGIRKAVKTEIITEKDHLDAIATIPKHLMKDRIVGATVEADGWFYTSIEYKNWGKDAVWFSVIASAKNSKVLCFSYTW